MRHAKRQVLFKIISKVALYVTFNLRLLLQGRRTPILPQALALAVYIRFAFQIPVANHLKAQTGTLSKMALVHYHDSESEDDDSVATPVDKMPPGVGEWYSFMRMCTF